MRSIVISAAAVVSAVCALCVSCGSAIAASGSGRLAVAPVSGKGLVVASAAGRGAHRVCIPARWCRRDGDPAWSADGRELAFSSPTACPPGSSCLASMTVAAPDGTCVNCALPVDSGGSPVPLGTGEDPTFVGDRGLIATIARGDLRVLTLTNRRDGRPVLVAGGVSAGAMSRRGIIAVARRGEIWIGRRGHLRAVGLGSQPAWSANGSELAFVRAGRIVILPNGPRKLRPLVAGRDPSWSPDGQWIAYVGPKQRIMEVSIDTGRSHRVGQLRGRSVAWGAPPQPPRCLTPAGTHTLTADGGGSVDDAYVPGLGQTIFGCVTSTGVARVLASFGVGNEDDYLHVTQAAVDGPYAGVITHETDAHYGGNSSSVIVFDLRTGLRSSTLGGEQLASNSQTEPDGWLNDLVINQTGDTAVHAIEIGPPSNGPGAPFSMTEAILASTQAAGVQTIATTPANTTNTALANLRLTGTTLTFTDNGTPRSTQLP